MAMSLEQLLAEEGFRGRRSRTTSRASFASEAVSEPLYPSRQDLRKSGSSSGVRMAERTKSDTTGYIFRDESPGRNDRVNSRRSKEGLLIDRRMKKETMGNYERRGSQHSADATKCSTGSLKDYSINEIVEVNDEIIETMGKDIKIYDSIYSNEVYSQSENGSNAKCSIGENRGRCKEAPKNEIRADNRHVDNSNKCSRSSCDQRSSMKEQEISKNTSSQNTRGLSKSQRQAKVEQTIVAEPALDEIAIQALISILTGHIKHFLKDEDFRESVRHSCYASLNFTGSEEINVNCSIIANLEQAIEAVERASEEERTSTSHELKKASLQLSVITGLSSTDLKDGFTSGISNLKLSACAHLYLTIIYKLQRKDRIAAKCLLKLFSVSPSQSRMYLLPDLWDHLFLPHFSQLQSWYNQEVDSLKNKPTEAKKLKLVDKVYNETLDSGTCAFAVYYKDWLTEGIEAPLLPCIQTPFIWGVQQQSHAPKISSPSPFSPAYPMVSKKLYDAVFRKSYKLNVHEEKRYEISVRSSYGFSAIEDKQVLPYLSETDKHSDQDIETSGASCPVSNLKRTYIDC